MRGARLQRRPPVPAATLLLALLGLAWPSRWQPPSYESRQWAFAAPRTSAPPSAEQLLCALGRELWVAGDQLLEASACLQDMGPLFGGGGGPPESPAALCNGALAIRNAAEAVLDGAWGDAWGELETAAVSCEAYLPAEMLQGLVDLFSYEEPVPSCGWPSAAASLSALAKRLLGAATRIRSNPNLRFRGGTAEVLEGAAGAFRRAAGLFAPGGFYMPPDPREVTPQEDTGPFIGNFQMQDEGEPQLAAGSYGARLLEEVRAELEAASGAAARRSALRRLVRRSHPDQNPGREAEVLPVLRYVQRLRARA